MNFEDLTPEQQAKARACKTPDDMIALAQEEGVELSDEQLQAVSGGWGCATDGKPCNDDCYSLEICAEN